MEEQCRTRRRPRRASIILFFPMIVFSVLPSNVDSARNKTSLSTPPGYFAELSLRDYLLVDQDYQPTLRPVRRANDVINVEIGLYVISLREFNPSLQRLRLQAYAQISWTDTMLTWKEGDSRFPNIAEIMLSAEKVWKPEVFLYYGGTLDAAAGPLVAVRSNGVVTRRIFQEYEASCRSSYASDFDAVVGGDDTTFECNVEFAVADYHNTDSTNYSSLNLTTTGSGAHVLDSYAENQCWRIIRSTSFRSSRTSSPSTQHGSGVVFQFQIQPNSPAIDTRPLVASLCRNVFNDVGFNYAGFGSSTYSNNAPIVENRSRFKQFVIALMASSCLMFLLPAPYNFMAGAMQIVGLCVCGTMQVASEKVFDETITIVALFAQLIALLLLAVIHSVECDHFMPKRNYNANKNLVIRPPPAALRRFAAVSLKFTPQNLWSERIAAKMQHSFQPLVSSATADGESSLSRSAQRHEMNVDAEPTITNNSVVATTSVDADEPVTIENNFSAVSTAEWCRVFEAFRKLVAMTYLVACVFIIAI